MTGTLAVIDFADRPAGAAAGFGGAEDPPFGTFHPTPAQALFIAAAKSAPFSRSALRQKAAVLSWLRDGPIDTTFRQKKFRLYPTNSSVEAKILLGKSYDRVEIDFLAGALSPGATFVDIGAHIGAYAIPLSKHVAPSGRVIAIEPNPAALARLRVNCSISESSNVTVVGQAASDREATLTVTPDARELGKAKVSERDGIAITARPLAAILKNSEVVRVGALKIDVEGHEDKVLPPFFVAMWRDLWPARIVIEDSSAEWRTDCLALLESKGYRRLRRTRSNVLLERGP